MLIVQISDLHLAGPGRKTLGIAPMAENLTRCVDHINRLEPQPDLVLVTGDVTNDGRREEAKQAASILSALRWPYYIIPGNHDDRSALWSVFGGTACPAMEQGFINYAIDDFDVRLIGMDSVAPGNAGGEICRTRAAWLEARLAEAPTRPTIIFMHHPPLRCGVLETDEDGFVGAQLLGAVVERFSNIKRIVCGHIHLLAHAQWRGVVVSTAPGMGMQLGLDLTKQHPSEFVLEDPGFLLHHWTPQKTLITHAVTVRDRDGPYLFDEHPQADTPGM
jgi:3',5'-cyclic AMP phosphodiesterase CpdA